MKYVLSACILTAALVIPFANKTYSQDRHPTQTHPGPVYGRDVGNGGEATIINHHPRLRDLVDNTVCNEAVRGPEFASRVPRLQEIMPLLHQVHWYLTESLQNDYQQLHFCLTQGRLLRVPTEDYDSVTVYTRETRQLMVRIGDLVLVDMPLFNALAPTDQAFAIIHESSHSIFPQGTAHRNYKVRNLVAALQRAAVAVARGADIDETRMRLADLIETLHMGIAPHTARLDDFRYEISVALAAGSLRDRAKAAYRARDVQPLLMPADFETFGTLLARLPSEVTNWVREGVAQNDEAQIVEAFQYGANPNMLVEPTATTPIPLINYAIRMRQSRLIQLLLNHPNLHTASITVVDAAESGDIALLEQLLRRGALANAVRADGATALIVAATRADLAMVRLLLQFNASLVRTGASGYCEPTPAPGSADPNGPLQIAVAAGNLPLLRLLLASAGEHGLEERGLFNIGTQPYWLIHPPSDRIGATAFWFAVAREDLEMARQLLEAGANPNTEVHGITPLQVAAYRGNVSMIRLLLSLARTRTDIGVAISATQSRAYGHVCWNSFMYGSGCNDNILWTPLMVAIERNHGDVVELLARDRRPTTLLESSPPTPVSLYCAANYREPECAPPLHLYLTQTDTPAHPEYGPSRMDWNIAAWAQFRGRVEMARILRNLR